MFKIIYISLCKYLGKTILKDIIKQSEASTYIRRFTVNAIATKKDKYRYIALAT